VDRVQAGEPVTAVAASLGRSRQWVYNWLARAAGREATWPADRSHRPAHLPQATPAKVEMAVRLVRLELYNEKRYRTVCRGYSGNRRWKSGPGSGLRRERFGGLSVLSMPRDSVERQRARVARGRRPALRVPRGNPKHRVP
jgi:hypothetical protein